jgi:hypothetical protein
MKLTACLLVLAASLGVAPVALAQNASQRAAVMPGRVQLLGADMAANCKAGDIARAHKLADACEGKQQCSFTPEPGDAAAEACARDSMALWDCGDGKTRYAALAPQRANQSREIKLECAPNAVASAAAPAAQMPTAQPVTNDATETVKADGVKLPAVKIVVKPPPVTGLDMSAAGVDAETARMDREVWYDPRVPKSGANTMTDIHKNLWNKPDHAPGSAVNKCSGAACQEGVVGEP